MRQVSEQASNQIANQTAKQDSEAKIKQTNHQTIAKYTCKGEVPTIRLRAQQHVSGCAVAQSHACEVRVWLNAYLRTWLPTCVLTPLVLPVADDLRSPLIDCVRESLRTWLLPSSLMCWCV